MWWIVLIAALIAGGNGFFWGLFVQAAIEVTPERRPYGRMIDLSSDEWRRL
jgi:hypothetical protein